MAISANMARLPVLLFGLADPRYPGMGSLLATGASFEQIGLPHHRIWGNVVEPGITGVSPQVFIDKMPANHMHVAAGDYVQELLHFCALSDIEPVLLN